MAEMSLDSAAADIGSQISDIALAGLQAGASAVTTVTGMVPAGSDSVSLQAAVSFAQEGMQALQQQASALQELMSTGQAIQQIVQQYASADTAAASAVATSAFQGGTGAGALGAGQLAAAAPSLMATAGQAGSLASGAAPTLMQGFSQGMQMGQGVQGALSGMSGGGAGGGTGGPMASGGVPPGGMPPSQLARNSEDGTAKTIDQPEELEADGASAGTGSASSAPVQLAVGRPETAPSRIEL